MHIGEEAVNVVLSFSVEPILSGDTKTITQAGQNIQLTCGFKANPAVAMSWRQNGSIVAFPSRFEQRMTSNTWTLSITKVAMSDTANYTCVAVTPSGNVTTLTFELIVGGKIRYILQTLNCLPDSKQLSC